MTVFRNKKDERLYKVFEVIRSNCICGDCHKKYLAVGLYHLGNVEVDHLEDFEEVAYT